MKNKPKINLIFSIIILILLFGGAYYASLRTCLPWSKSYIEILYPKAEYGTYYIPFGEETKMLVNWKSCNLKNNKVAIVSKNNDKGTINFQTQVPDTGKTNFFHSYKDTGNFKIIICGTNKVSNYKLDLYHPNGCNVFGESDLINISTSLIPEWKYLTLEGVSVPYPPNWGIRNPNSGANECQETYGDCSFTATMDNLDYKIYDPNITSLNKLSDQDAIYISSSDKKKYSNCPEQYEKTNVKIVAIHCPFRNIDNVLQTTVIGDVVIQTFGTNIQVLDIYNQIVSKLKEAYNIKTFSNDYISFDYPQNWSVDVGFSGILSFYDDTNTAGTPILTINFKKMCSNNIDLITDPNGSSVCLSTFGNVGTIATSDAVKKNELDGYIMTSYLPNKTPSDILLLLKNIKVE